IGFRDLFIRTKNQLDLSLFHFSKKVYVGSDGWLFQRSLTDARLSFEHVPEETYLKIERSFADLDVALGRRGIRLVVVDYPDKSEFYSEFLPPNVPNLPRDGNLSRLRRALDRNTGLIHVDVGKLLQPLKQKGQPLYTKTDIHTNVIGGMAIV